MYFVITGHFQKSIFKVLKKKIVPIQLHDYISSNGSLEMPGLGSLCDIIHSCGHSFTLYNMHLYRGSPVIHQPNVIS